MPAVGFRVGGISGGKYNGPSRKKMVKDQLQRSGSEKKLPEVKGGGIIRRRTSLKRSQAKMWESQRGISQEGL